MFDKAYVKTSGMRKIDSVSAFFIVRRKQGMSYSVIKELTAPKITIYGDKEIVFTNRGPRQGYPTHLRMRQYYSEERNETMDIVTNK